MKTSNHTTMKTSNHTTTLYNHITRPAAAPRSATPRWISRALTALGIILGVMALGWAGNSDRIDDTVNEMKNNGTYWQLAREYPEASDASLVDIYNHDRASGR